MGYARIAWLFATFLVTSCAAPPSTAPGLPSIPPPLAAAQPAGGGGHITYSLADGTVYRLEANEGAQPQAISSALDRLSPRAQDSHLNLSFDGKWLVLLTGRFDAECASWNCLAVAQGDLSKGEAVRAGGAWVHPEGFPAVAAGGGRIVFPGTGGPHAHDLYAISRNGDAWSAPLLLTGTSSYPYNDQPTFSPDGSKVLFDCGSEAYGGEGTAICEVGASGNPPVRVVARTSDPPAGLQDHGALHHAGYALDGGIVFEGDWDGEQIWRLAPGVREPARMKTIFDNDNSPCVLPDGRIVSLWLGRPGGASRHELKVMSRDGSAYSMALTGVDVADVGIGCGG